MFVFFNLWLINDLVGEEFERKKGMRENDK